MKTIRVSRTFNPAKLHEELAGAGVRVVTVRASSPDLQGPAFYGVVVLEDGADVGKATSLIQAHVEPRTPSRQPEASQMEKALREMERV